jgi:hypothetical protein
MLAFSRRPPPTDPAARSAEVLAAKVALETLEKDLAECETMWEKRDDLRWKILYALRERHGPSAEGQAKTKKAEEGYDAESAREQNHCNHLRMQIRCKRLALEEMARRDPTLAIGSTQGGRADDSQASSESDALLLERLAGMQSAAARQSKAMADIMQNALKSEAVFSSTQGGRADDSQVSSHALQMERLTGIQSAAARETKALVERMRVAMKNEAATASRHGGRADHSQVSSHALLAAGAHASLVRVQRRCPTADVRA